LLSSFLLFTRDGSAHLSHFSETSLPISPACLRAASVRGDLERSQAGDRSGVRHRADTRQRSMYPASSSPVPVYSLRNLCTARRSRRLGLGFVVAATRKQYRRI
jgi:hypothetical protein